VSQPLISGSRVCSFFTCLSLALALAICGGCGGSGGGAGAVGAVNLTLSDPPVCEAPQGPFTSVWVTVTRVRAHLSSAAGSSGPGWVDLLDLRGAPVQLDLLNLGTPNCLLTQLGATAGLPVGNYQQIRLHLLSNTPAPGEVVPSPNVCAPAGGYNCVVHVTNGYQLLQLGSQANTGLKIPPGQIAGGGLTVLPNQMVDLNIDFDACASIVELGNGGYRLKPTLHAGQIFPLTGMMIAGRIVDVATNLPLIGGAIMVAAEQPDAGGTDRIVATTYADPFTGTFSLCPLPLGLYDLVVVAVDGAGIAYGPTVTFGVLPGVDTGDIPITATAGAPATMTGMITSDDGAGSGADADITVAALMDVIPAGGVPIPVTIPALPGSTSLLATAILVTCSAGTACASYALMVPAGNAAEGTFTAAGTAYSAPSAAPFLYSVEAEAFVPGSGGTRSCIPSHLLTSLDVTAAALAVTAGMTVAVETLSFTGCSTAP